jgi:hypothetical protein
MTTQYTPTLKLALPVTGELSGTWGDVVNDNITSMIEQAIAGLSTINTWTGNAHTLTTANGTTSESRCAMLVAATGGGAPNAAAEIICPAAAKLYVLQNNTSYAVTLKTSAGTGVAVAAGDTAFLFCDGTNVNSCVTTIVNGHITGNLTVDGNATINGNTTLGNATSDTVTVTARVASSVLPSADNTYDLGSSGNSWKDLYIDGTATMALVAISGGTINGVSIGATTPATFLAVDNLSLDGNTIASTNTNGNIVIAPNGTGDVQLDADTVRVGDSGAAATLTSNGAGALTVTTGGAADLTLSTNSGTTSGTITIANGANGNITLTPDGTGDVILSADRVQIGDSNTDTTLTTNGTGNLNLSTNNGTNSGTIQIAQGANGNITLTPNGTGSVSVPKLVWSGGTSGRVPYLTTGGQFTDSANLSFTGTNLGIGIATASTALQVYSATADGAVALFQNASGTTAGYVQISPGLSSFGGPVLEMNNTQTGVTQRTFMYPRNGNFFNLNQSSGSFSWGINGGSEYMRITSTGLGVGVAAPVSRIDALSVGNTTAGSKAFQLIGGADNGTAASMQYGLYVSQAGARYTNQTALYAVAGSTATGSTGTFGVTYYGVNGVVTVTDQAQQQGSGVYGVNNVPTWNYNRLNAGVQGLATGASTTFSNQYALDSVTGAFGGHFVSHGKANSVGVYADAYLDASPGAGAVAYPFIAGSNGTFLMTVSSAGQVLIGTSTSPTTTNQVPLLVKTSGGPAITFYSNTSASMAGTCGITTTTYGNSKYSGYQLTSNGSGIFTNSSTASTTYISGSGAIVFGYLNQDPFENASATFADYGRFTSAGNFVVGGASGSQKITSVGNIKIAGAQNGNVGNLIMTRTDSSWSMNNETDLRLYNSTSDTDSPSNLRFTFSTAGTLMVGAGPNNGQSYKLGVYKAASDVQLLINSDNGYNAYINWAGYSGGWSQGRDGGTGYLRWNNAVNFGGSQVMTLTDGGDLRVGGTGQANSAVITATKGSGSMGMSAYAGANNNTINTIASSAGSGGGLIIVSGVSFGSGQSFSRLYLAGVKVAGGAASVFTTAISAVGEAGASFSFADSGGYITATASGLPNGSWTVMWINI